MFGLSKKTKDDNGNPFEGYVADGLAAADFKAEAEAETAVPSDPTPASEPLDSNAQRSPKPVGVSPTTPPKLAPVTPAPPVVQSAPTAAQTSVHVEPANPTSDQVDTAIKEAEAATELPKEELLDGGDAPVSLPENPVTTEITTDRVEEVVVEAPTPGVIKPEPPRPPESPKPVGQTVPVLSTNEERAAVVAAHKELAELLGWAERDTNAHMNEIQLVIDDLNARIDNLRTSFVRDTARLTEDARIAFKENIEKNITLLKDQANREQAKKDVLRSQKEEFIDKIHEALKRYRDSKR